ncbi:uncharacterized protein LOC131944708 [Physella acuta]|uniref:uncharacterized protein LOC131944708 n=1 Tax=Physella acuta TaxID=109671 RepID=UPI0027DE0521|nr:uncharacterized protein LOC131944708 [Physella acuta]
MLSPIVLCFLFFLWGTHSASGQTIISPSEIEEGGAFTVTCDASRAGVPEGAATISRLTISWTNGTAPPTTYARYRLFPAPYSSTFPPQTSLSRNWTFTFNGSQQGTSDAPSNRNTMRIEMVVNDAVADDAGLYYCNATYLDVAGDLVTVMEYQNVTSTTSPATDDRGSLTAACNATNAGVPATAATVVALTISWTPGPSSLPTTLARYRIFPAPYSSSFTPQNSTGKNWTFTHTGSLQGSSDNPANRHTMRIEMAVHGAKCTDAGSYFCNATYINSFGDITSAWQSLKLTSRDASVGSHQLYQYMAFPTIKGDNPSNFTMMCKINGPKTLRLDWEQILPPAEGFVPYPNPAHILRSEPVPIGSCDSYAHASTLRFAMADRLHCFIYRCSVRDGNVTVSQANLMPDVHQGCFL